MVSQDEFECSETSPREKMNFTVLSQADIGQRQAHLIDTVSAVLPRADASILLCRYRWSVDRVLDAWFSDENGEGVRNFDPPAAEEIRCGICQEMTVSEFRSAGCGHLFCLPCWGRYVTVSIDDGPGCLTLRCPEPSCQAAVSQGMIHELVSDRHKDMYARFYIGSYVEGNKNIKWCPGPGCGYAIEFDSGGGDGAGHDVSCLCGHAFCWNCREDAHRPVDCDTVAKWIKKNRNTNRTLADTNRTLADTKPCPKCMCLIEKNGGCMRMTCWAHCNFEFCWLCLEPWSGHNSCNQRGKAKQEGTITEELRTVMAKLSIDRYAHYYERWNANDLLRKKALEDLNKMEIKGLDKLRKRLLIQGLVKPVTELEFIAKAWQQIVECRRVLKWTYVYGYYMPEKENAKKQFFEHWQGLAEALLEALHHCAETELGGYLNGVKPSRDFNNFVNLKLRTSVTGTYFENLVKALENGLSDVDSQRKLDVTATSSTKAGCHGIEDPING